MDECIAALSENLWRIIRKKDISVTAAAGLWGISRGELTRILGKKKDVRISTLAKISDGTGKPVADLICEIK